MSFATAFLRVQVSEDPTPSSTLAMSELFYTVFALREACNPKRKEIKEPVMFTAVLKATTVVGLVIALFWRSPNYATLLSFLVCMAALVVVGQAMQLKNYIWIAVFFAICALFNPVFPVAMSPNVRLMANIVCAGLFASSLLLLKTLPRMSVPSITDRTPGSQSL
jgi:hypothetical protein